jgi:hypothetical protein
VDGCKHTSAKLRTIQRDGKHYATVTDATLIDGKKKSDVPEIGGATKDASVLNLFRHLKSKVLSTPHGQYNLPYYFDGI